MRARIIDNLDALTSTERDWNQLATSMKSPLLRYEWFLAAAQAFCPPCKLHVTVVEDENGIAAIAPLALKRVNGMWRLEILGAAFLSEPSGFLYRDETALRELVRSIHASRRPLFLRGLATGSVEFRLLTELQPRILRYGATAAYASPWIPITTSWEKFLPTISASWRSSFRRSQRRAEEWGPVAYEFVAATRENVDSLFAEMFRIEAASWKSRAGSAVESQTDLRNFFSSYVCTAAEKGILEFAFMRVGGKAIASQLLLRFGNRLWVLKIGYDETFSRCSPGILLMQRVVQHAFESGLEAFELLGASAPWLSIWKPEMRIYAAYRRYPILPLPMISHASEEIAEIVWLIRTTIRKSERGIPWKALYERLDRYFHPQQFLEQKKG